MKTSNHTVRRTTLSIEPLEERSLLSGVSAFASFGDAPAVAGKVKFNEFSFRCGATNDAAQHDPSSTLPAVVKPLDSSSPKLS